MNKFFVDKKGSALIYVMLSLVFLLLMISIMVSMTSSNLGMASEQESGMQAYYIARSGVEAAYEVLLMTNLLDSFIATPSLVKTDTVNFEDGSALVTVTTTGTGINQKIQIKSVGTMIDTNVSREVSLVFYAQYGENSAMVWSR